MAVAMEQEAELLLASERHVAARVRSMVANGISPNCWDRFGRTPLVLALMNRDNALAQFLVEHGADVNAVSPDGTTPLLAVTIRDLPEAVLWLAGAGANVDAVQRTGETLMEYAARSSAELMQVLARCGADVNTPLRSGETPLYSAARKGYLGTVRALVESGARLDALSRNDKKKKKTAVSAAAEGGNWHVVQYLLTMGADASAVLKRGETLVDFATRLGLWSVVGLIVRAGGCADVPRHTLQEVLWNAVRTGQLEVVRPCVECGADPNAILENGDTPLLTAVKRANWEVAASLAECGADVNSRDDRDRTALMYATERGGMSILRTLANSGADLNACLENGDTPLLTATKHANWEAAVLLIDCGADVNVRDGLGRTALMFAAEKGKFEIARRLINRGAEVDVVDHRGQSASLMAAINDHLAVHRLLMPYTLRSQIRHSDGISPSPERELQSWRISPFEISLQAFVDAQSVGGEYRAKWLDADVVVKLFAPVTSGATFAEEVTMWHQLRHPNVIKLYGACDLGLHFFVCEFAGNGSLIEYLACQDVPRTPWKFMLEAALGLAYLHERNIVHGNLRGSNILIGSDDVAKLSDFELSGTAKEQRHGHSLDSLLGFKRWQSPERLKGEQASFASDIYSLGLCAVEALTGCIPWANDSEKQLIYAKEYWIPSSESGYLAPAVLTRELRNVTARMCAWKPERRVAAIEAVRMLQGLAAKEEAQFATIQPDPEPLVDFEQFGFGKFVRLWSEVLGLMAQPGVSGLQRRAFQQLEAIRTRLCGSSWSPRTLHLYQTLLEEFVAAMQPNSYQNRILQLSSTRATCCSMHMIQHRIDAMWALIKGAPESFEVRKRLWDEERTKQFQLFVSEVSETLLVLHDMVGEEDRSTFAALLESEINAHGTAYSTKQLAVLKKAYDEITKDVPAAVVTSVKPWFLPWYELVVDKSACLGFGSFGSVYRAKWLDSEVVVKEVKKIEASSVLKWSAPTMSAEAAKTTNGSPEDTSARIKMRKDFEREVAVWFDLSHPHVVRLFGACHVGVPFFACEYAKNGSLDKYLRKHPTELWSKLHEAALGVQYLQARGIVHGDLKCNNIVVGADGKAKVTDFGLSSEIEDASAELTGASQWVAPECLKDGVSLRSFASDVYALGMCVVEALRVKLAATVKKNERGYTPLPWGKADSTIVKSRVLSRELPQRPEECPDAAWTLVERMCSYNPKDRIKISTVVDEIAQLAGCEAYGEVLVDAAELEMTVPAIIAQMKSSMSTADDRLTRTYRLLWDRLEHVASMIADSGGDLELLRPIVTRGCQGMPRLTTGLFLETQVIESTFRGYDLHRRLDKLIDANFWPVHGEGGKVHQWQTSCKSLLRDSAKQRDDPDTHKAIYCSEA